MAPANLAFVICTDNNYAPHAGTCLFSLLLSTPNRDFDIHIITNNVSKENVLCFARLADTFGARIHIIDGSSALQKLRSTSNSAQQKKFPHISDSTLLRLYYDELVPQAYARVAYIDCDTIFTNDATLLLNEELHGHTIGAVPDLFINRNQESCKDPENTFPYFNAGILLINDAQWRSDGVSETLKNILMTTKPQNLTYSDQDALNILFRKTGYHVLPSGYNYQYMATINTIFHPPGTTTEDAEIIHFAGEIKPWHQWAPAEHSKLYERFRIVSPWGKGYKRDKPRSERQLRVGYSSLVNQGRFQEACTYSEQLILLLQGEQGKALEQSTCKKNDSAFTSPRASGAVA